MSHLIPTGWTEQSIDQICSIEMGQSPSSSTYNECRDGLPFLQGNADFGYRHPSPQIWCNKPAKIANKDSILLSVRAPVGEINIADRKYCIGRGVSSITPESVDLEFLFQFLLLHKPSWGRVSTGSTFASINKKVISELRLLIPPLWEQERIAEILGSVDATIDATRRVIDQTRQLKRALMQELLTHGLPGRHTRFKPSPLGEIPADWEVVKLGEVAHVQTGVAKNGKIDKKAVVSVPYLRVANVQDGYLNLTEIKEIEIERERIPRYLLQKGDVLFNEGGDADKLGRGCVWEGQIAPCAHQNHVFAVRCSDAIDPYFLALQSASQRGKRFFFQSSKQTTNLASINSSQLKSFPLLIAPLEEQKRIIQVLNSVELKASSEQKLLTELELIKTALMQVLLTGEVRVSQMKPMTERVAV